MGNISTPETLTLRWAELINDPALADLPYKIELNAWGKIEMTPASFWHGRMQGNVSVQLAQQLPDGEVLVEVPILTEIGVRVPDVAWGSREYLAAIGEASPAPRAPEICVEVVSASNTEDEIRAKTRAYLAAGAREVWILSEDGTWRIHDASGERAASQFPVRLSLPKREPPS
jgi:Uma2 family endonuclease